MASPAQLSQHGVIQHGMGGMPGMSGELPLPGWVRVAGVVLFLAVVVLHVRHAVGKQVPTRVWHGAHVLMALGMVVMLVPAAAGAASGAVGAAVFVLAAVLALVGAGFDRVRRVVWVLTAVELGAMACMLAMPPVMWLAWVLVAWLVVQAAVWAGRLVVPAEEGSHDLPLRLSLVVMDLGMAAMLAGMPFGMHAAHGGMTM